MNVSDEIVIRSFTANYHSSNTDCDRAIEDKGLKKSSFFICTLRVCLYRTDQTGCIESHLFKFCRCSEYLCVEQTLVWLMIALKVVMVRDRIVEKRAYLDDCRTLLTIVGRV